MKSKEKNKFRDVPIFNNIKEVIYNSVKLYRDNIAFVTKIKKENKSVEYINHTYQNFLDDINSFGTALYALGLKEKELQLLAEIDMNGRLLILVIYLEELFLFLLIKNYN
jgi:long-subunit acyl-CoA synthetase (AMP-forming)